MTGLLRQKWGGVLMMGGRAQRMGGLDKSKLTFGGNSFQNIAIARLEASFSKVAISAGSSEKKSTEHHQFWDVTLQDQLIGPAGGLLAAFNWAQSEGLDGFVTLPVDTPILPENICEGLCQNEQPRYAQQGKQAHWMHAAWPLSVAANVRRQVLDNHVFALRQLHAAIGSTPTLFTPKNNGEFRNINTVQDLNDLNKLTTQAPPH